METKLTRKQTVGQVGQTAYERMSSWQKTAYYLLVFVTLVSMAVVCFVLGGGLRNIESQALKDIFLDAQGYPAFWVWWGTSWVFGLTLPALFIIKFHENRR